MSKQPKLTQWFKRTKPEIVGVYKRNIPGYGGSVYSHWNGAWWGLCSRKPEWAIHPSKKDFKSCYQKQPWLGLAENPEK